MTSPTVKKEWSPPGKTDILNYRYYEASQGKGQPIYVKQSIASSKELDLCPLPSDSTKSRAKELVEVRSKAQCRTEQRQTEHKSKVFNVNQRAQSIISYSSKKTQEELHHEILSYRDKSAQRKLHSLSPTSIRRGTI